MCLLKPNYALYGIFGNTNTLDLTLPSSVSSNNKVGGNDKSQSARAGGIGTAADSSLVLSMILQKALYHLGGKTQVI